MNKKTLILTLLFFLASLNGSAQIFISELFSYSNGNSTLRKEKYIEIYNPLACEIDLDGWELFTVSNCIIGPSTDLSGIMIGPGQALRFSSSEATLYQDGILTNFVYAPGPTNINSNWNGQWRDGARLVNNGVEVDLALPANYGPNCLTSTNYFQNSRLIRDPDICQGNTTFNSGEWSLSVVSTIADIPAIPTHLTACTAPPFGTPGLWTGAKSEDWHDCANWSDHKVPTVVTDVFVNETALNDCIVMTGDANCSSLTVTSASGGDISLSVINGNTLNVANTANLNRSNGNGSTTVLLNAGSLIIDGDLDITMNSPLLGSSVSFDMTSDESNVLICDDLDMLNSSPVLNHLKFTMGVNSGNVDCDNLNITGNGSSGACLFEADQGISASVLEINNNLTLLNSGELDFNSGFVNISGSITDLGFTSGILFGGLTNSTFQFKGSTDQFVLSLNQVNFYNMSLLNVLGASVILDTEVIVHGLLNLGNGYVQLNGNTLRIEEPDPTAIIGTGGVISESTDFSGNIAWNIDNNPGTYTFPFATNVGGLVIPFIFNMTQGETDYVEIATYGTAWDNLPFPPGVSSLDNTSTPGNAQSVIDRWWNIEAPDVGGSPILEADITFTYPESEHNVGCSACTNAKRHNGTIWQPGFIDPTPIYNDIPGISRQVGIQGVQQFSPWGISATFAPLPVEMLSFEADLNEKETVDLRWATTSEVNSHLFEVERSNGDTQFDKIGEVLAQGTSHTLANYAFEDSHPLVGWNAYRLKQIDLNGQYEYSEIRTVLVETNGISVVSSNEGYIIYSDEIFTAKIYDTAGRSIWQEVGTSLFLDINRSGIFILELKDVEGNVRVEKLLF